MLVRAATNDAKTAETRLRGATQVCPVAYAVFISRPESRASPFSQQGLRIELTDDLDHQSDNPRPTRLVAGADAGAVVAVEIFVEQQTVAPVGIFLEFLGAAEHRPPAGFVAQEDPG